MNLEASKGANARRMAFTWTPNMCKPMAFGALFRGLGPLFCVLLAPNTDHN